MLISLIFTFSLLLLSPVSADGDSPEAKASDKPPAPPPPEPSPETPSTPAPPPRAPSPETPSTPETTQDAKNKTPPKKKEDGSFFSSAMDLVTGKKKSSSPPPAPDNSKDTQKEVESKTTGSAPASSQDGQSETDPKKNLGSALLGAAIDVATGKQKPTLPPNSKPLDPTDPKQAAGIVASEAIDMVNKRAQENLEKSKDNVVIPEDFKDHTDAAILKIFEGLIKERRKLQRFMFVHIVTSFVLGILTYFLRSNPILLQLGVLIDNHNESWGGNIEALWINHQEKMADFLLRLMHKKHIDPKTMVGKKMKVEYKHKKFASVPVYRTFPDEPLPDDAKQINNNKLNLWKNWWS